MPNPYPEMKSQSEEVKKNALQEKEALNERTMESLKLERNRLLAANELIEGQSDDASENAEDDTQEYQMQEKPSMDIFKAIFADSDSESEEIAMGVNPKKIVPVDIKSVDSDNNSSLFRPVFRKKEERKGKPMAPKKPKSSAFRPSHSGVKLVFDFEEESSQAIALEKHTKPSNIVKKKKKDKSESEDEWVEAPQKKISRSKASDLI